MRESRIQRQIRIAVNRTGKARVFPNVVGLFEDGHGGMRRVGLGTGSADLVGVVRGGRAIALEVKNETGRVRPEQHRWHDAARAWGVYVAVVRSVDDAIAAVDDALATASCEPGVPLDVA